jgi:hypothetical protein
MDCMDVLPTNTVPGNSPEQGSKSCLFVPNMQEPEQATNELNA